MGDSIRCVVSTAIALVLSAAPILAGPVTFGDGTINVAYFGGGEGDDTQSFDVTAPGTKEESFDGLYVISPDFSTERGHSGASYDIADLADGADFDVTIFHSNKGTEGGTDGGSVDFALAFTTDRPLHYVWHIEPTGATQFQASLDETVEGLEIDVFGNGSGSLFVDGNIIPKTLEGDLPAGAHGVSISMSIANGRSTNGVGEARGSFTLALSDQGAGTPIPLPPAVWTGLATLVSMGAGSGLLRTRHRRRLARQT